MNAQLLPECKRLRRDGVLTSEKGLSDECVISHLDDCADCRAFLDSESGDHDHWQRVKTHLQPTEFDYARTDGFSAASVVGSNGRRSFAIQDVLDSLSPTDDPHKLGRLGSYEITAVVGVGGMGVVLKAVDPSLERVVAVKLMAPSLAHSDKARKRFSREAKAAAAVLHPNVVPIHSVASDGVIPYLVMSYIRGGSLQRRIENEGPLSVVEILRIGSQIAAGLAAAHEQGLVHRDIKPENILLEEGVERVSITDFGLARAVDDNTVTQNGAIAGTPMYMSPEQALGEQVDQKSDLFSLGSVLYAVCTGRPPYSGDTSYSVMRQIIDEGPMPVCDVNPDVPDWLAGIVEKLMVKDKSERFSSAAEVHRLLDACLSHVQQPETVGVPNEVLELRNVLKSTYTAKEPTPALRGRFRKWVSVALVLGLVGGVAGLMLYLQHSRRQQFRKAYADLRSYLQTGESDQMSLNCVNVLLSEGEGHVYLKKLDQESDRFVFVERDLPHGLDAAAGLLLDDRMTPRKREFSLTTWRKTFTGGQCVGLPVQIRADGLRIHPAGAYEQRMKITFSASTEQQHRKELEEVFRLQPGAEYVVDVAVADIIQDRVDWIDIWKEGKPTGKVAKVVRTSEGYPKPDPKMAILAIRGIMAGLETKKITEGRYPTLDEGLEVISNRRGSSEKTDFFLIDPWGQRYGYQSPGRHGAKPDVWSVGPDGKTRTADDICSWKLLPNPAAAARPGVDIASYRHNQDTHNWTLQPVRTSQMRIQLLYISDGDVHVISESQIRSNRRNVASFELILDMNRGKDDPKSVTPSLAVFADGLPIQRSTGAPVTVSGPFKASPVVTSGGLAWDHSTVLFHRCVFDGDLTYRMNDIGAMKTASEEGADFVALAVEWVAEGALNPPAWACGKSGSDAE